MNHLLDSFPIIAPALVAGLIILLSHIPLGKEVVNRGIIFIDLAIAQIAGLGIIIASFLGYDAEGWQLQSIAFFSAISGAMLISVMERFSGDFQEAIIGIVFVLAATASLIFLANNPHGGEHLQDLLSGQILWVNWHQLLAPAVTSGIVLAFYLLKPRWFSGKAFYLFFAIAITQSVQLIGVYLVFSSLIMPAIATAKLPRKIAIITALVIGALAYIAGLLASLVYDLPSGAAIVWAMMIFAIAGNLATRHLQQLHEQ